MTIREITRDYLFCREVVKRPHVPIPTVLKCLRGHLEVRSSLWRAQRGFYVQYGEILALNPRGKSQKITDEQIRPIVRLKKEGE